MAKSKSNPTISVVNPVCCGLDVHKDFVSACLMSSDDHGREQVVIRKFGAFTDELQKLRDWLIEHECPIVSMESTGVYWQPVHNVLEEAVRVVLINARHFHQLPGKKTDLADCQWLAGLLRHGLLKGSFIPPRQVRDWRDLVRMRKTCVEMMADTKRRVQKLFESANIKIDSVVTDLFGASGRNLMQLLQDSENITLEEVRGCLRGSLQNKADELYRAVQGFFRDHHRFILQGYLGIIQDLEREISRINQRLVQIMSDHEELVERLTEIPGIQDVAARAILSQVGPSLAEFPTSGQLASWCGLCPGNNESAGKRKTGKSSVRGHPLKSLLVEVSWAAVKTKGSYYKEKYYRLKARRGAKRAIVAVAHRILRAIYQIVKNGRRYEELGEDHLLQRNREVTLFRLRKQAEYLGYQLVPVTT